MRKLRVLAVLAIVLVLSFTCLATKAGAASIVDSGYCGDNLTWTLNSDGTLAISGSGKMYDYYGDAPWCGYDYEIQTVTIQSGVTSIGSSAFYDCFRLTNVTIPNSVTSIGEFAFEYCTRLPDIKIPSTVTEIGRSAFFGCSSLTNINVNSGNRNYSSVNGALYNKDKTLLVAWPGGKSGPYDLPKSVTTIGEFSFSGSSELTSITIPNNVSEIGYAAFYYCSNLSSVKIPNSVTSIGGCAFDMCDGLTSITIPANVTTIGSRAFSCCRNLTHIYVDGGNKHYSSDNGVLYSKDKTKLIAYPGGKGGSYAIPNSVTTIGEYAFCEWCNLSSITIPNSVTSIGSRAFSSEGFIFDETQTSIVFMGDRPKMGNDIFSFNVTATAYYPKNNTTWNGIRGESFDGTITWKTHDMVVAKIITQPKTAYAKLGEKVSTTVKAEGDGLTYQWYVTDVGDTKYYLSSIDTPTYSVKMTEEKHGRKAYCIITDEYGNSVKTKTVTFRMAASIKKQPKNAYAKLGEKVKISVKALGDGLTYQWYVTDVGDTKYYLSSIDTSTYSVKMTEEKHGRKAYCVVTDKYGNSVKTQTVTLRMAVSIKTQPKNTYTKKNETAKVKLKAVGDDLTYEWYIKNAGAKKYSKSSVTSATYSCKMNDKSKDRYVYCIVTDKYGNTEKTKTVVLRMAATITTQPKSVTVAEGKTAKVTVKAVGDELTYEWYIKNEGTSKFSKSSVTKATYSCKMSEKTDGRQVYCVVTDKYGKTVKSKTVTLSMK